LGRNGVLKSIEFYAINDGYFELKGAQFDSKICGFDSDIRCAKYFNDGYDLYKGKERTLFTNNITKGYHLYDGLTIKLLSDSLFIVNSNVLAVYKLDGTLYPQIDWTKSEARPIFCLYCYQPLENTPLYIRLTIEYSNQLNNEPFLYTFTKTYPKNGNFEMVAKTSTSPSVQDKEAINISNSAKFYLIIYYLF
jgi:hypothetical protein